MSELILLVRLAGERVALPAIDVEAVVELEGVSPVPRTPPHVAGLAALRSRVLSVIDCYAALELERTEAPGNQAVVVENAGHPYALLVDEVEDVTSFDGEIQPLRSPLAGGWRRVARGMVEIDGDLLLLVDTEALVEGPVPEFS